MTGPELLTPHVVSVLYDRTWTSSAVCRVGCPMTGPGFLMPYVVSVLTGRGILMSCRVCPITGPGLLMPYVVSVL
jgi:hypothetical protein